MKNNTEHEISRRSQPVPGAELNRRLLERAEKMNEGKKTIGNKEPKAVFSVTGTKEDNTMDKNIQVSEIRSRRPAAFVAAAAVLALLIGGGAYAYNYGRSGLDTEPVAGTEATSDSAGTGTEEQPKPGDYYTVDGKKANDWAEQYLAQNKNTIGFISVPGMAYDDGVKCIDEPVVIAEDNEYYQHHGFDGSDYELGTIFADAGTEIGSDGTQPHIIQLYGYEMPDYTYVTSDDGDTKFIYNTKGVKAAGFSTLTSLENFKILQQFPIIEFKTIWQDGGEYAVIGMTDVQGDALGIGKVDDISGWAKDIRDLSFFDVDIDCGADDDYLVLNIYHKGITNYRIFAKKLDESDNKEQIVTSYRLKEGEQDHVAADESMMSNLVNIELPLPKGMRGIISLTARVGEDVDLSEDGFYDGDSGLFETTYSLDDVMNLPEKFSFSVPGEGKQKLTIIIEDPLSSDSTRNKIKYAVVYVDFTTGTYTVVGEPDYDAVRELFAPYGSAQGVRISLDIPEEAKDIVFEAYVDDELADTISVASGKKTKNIELCVEGTGKKPVFIQARDKNTGAVIIYASCDVDFYTGTYKFANGGEPKTAYLKQLNGTGSRVFVEIPVPTGYEKNVVFEAYYEDILMGKALYTKDSERPFGITLDEDGVDKISFKAVFDDKTIDDYLVAEVDFDNGTYEFTKEPQLGAFDMLKDE